MVFRFSLLFFLLVSIMGCPDEPGEQIAPTKVIEPKSNNGVSDGGSSTGSTVADAGTGEVNNVVDAGTHVVPSQPDAGLTDGGIGEVIIDSGASPVTNYCNPNPCQNESVCVNGSEGYICTCKAHFKGAHCENTWARCIEDNDYGANGVMDVRRTTTYGEHLKILLTEQDNEVDGVVDARIRHVYDAHGNETQKEQDSNADGIFEYRYNYVYDDNQNMVYKDREQFSTYELYASRTTYTHDANGNILTEVYDFNSDEEYSSSEYHSAYYYDANGNLLYAEKDNGYDGNVNTQDTYTYDVYGRIQTKEHENMDSSNDDYLETYTYDDEGNLLTFVHDELATPNIEESSTYTYDANGQVLTHEKSTYTVWGSVGYSFTTYTYDAMGRLIKTEADNEISSCSYTEDENASQRLIELDTDADGNANQRTIITCSNDNDDTMDGGLSGTALDAGNDDSPSFVACPPETPGYGEPCAENTGEPLCGSLVCDAQTGEAFCHDAQVNDCGGCEDLDTTAGELGEPCGEHGCGTAWCDDEPSSNATVCEDDHPQNDCGGCDDLEPSDMVFGEACSACGTGTMACLSTDEMICWHGRSDDNACGFCERCILSHALMDQRFDGAYVGAGTTAIIEDTGSDGLQLVFEPLFEGPLASELVYAKVYLSVTEQFDIEDDNAGLVSDDFETYFAHFNHAVSAHRQYTIPESYLGHYSYVVIYDFILRAVISQGPLMSGGP